MKEVFNVIRPILETRRGALRNTIQFSGKQKLKKPPLMNPQTKRELLHQILLKTSKESPLQARNLPPMSPHRKRNMFALLKILGIVGGHISNGEISCESSTRRVKGTLTVSLRERRWKFCGDLDIDFVTRSAFRAAPPQASRPIWTCVDQGFRASGPGGCGCGGESGSE